MNSEQFSDNSDSSDEDYNPVGPSEVVSEVDSDGEPEDPLSDTEDLGKRGAKRKKKYRRKAVSKKPNTTTNEEENQKPAEANVQTEEDKKKHADSLWDMFKKDTGFKTTAKEDDNATKNESKAEPKSNDTDKVWKTSNKVKITQVFEFAGEEVRVEKEVPSESAEARLLTKTSITAATKSTTSVPGKSAGLKGIGSVLNQLGKKQKLSTLEKTKLDWDRFKQDENIEEELKAHTKGKDSYLDRQDFLERADLRRFEIEREVRAIERNKRLNNAPQ